MYLNIICESIKLRQINRFCNIFAFFSFLNFARQCGFSKIFFTKTYFLTICLTIFVTCCLQQMFKKDTGKLARVVASAVSPPLHLRRARMLMSVRSLTTARSLLRL